MVKGFKRTYSYVRIQLFVLYNFRQVFIHF